MQASYNTGNSVHIPSVTITWERSGSFHVQQFLKLYKYMRLNQQYPTPWSLVFLEKPTFTHPTNKLLAFCGARGLNTLFTRTATGLYPEPDEFSPHPHPTSLTCISSHLRLGLPSGSFTYVFRPKLCMQCFLSRACYMLYTSHIH
jgi:hypothetical protein